MKSLFCLFTFFLGWSSLVQAQVINDFLDQYGINPVTISFHPSGDALVSTSLDQSDLSQYLLLISKEQGTFRVDTLETSRPNRSAFSRGGEYLVYNYFDPVSGDFYTAKRKYDGVEDIGPPIFSFRAEAQTSIEQHPDYAGVHAAITDYVEALYEADSTKIIRSVHPDLRKRGY
ncbi:MAG TPA: hypothetical protein VJ953_11360 [Saprospiraceae bacterium]|nr:hypothetical protein [Saprospiraceae bacterium]